MSGPAGKVATESDCMYGSNYYFQNSSFCTDNETNGEEKLWWSVTLLAIVFIKVCLSNAT